MKTDMKYYDDVRELFDQALSSPKGIRITCRTRDAAVILRQRFNYFRKLHRLESKEIHPDPNDPRHGRSVYDILILRIGTKGGLEESVLSIEPHTANYTVEAIT